MKLVIHMTVQHHIPQIQLFLNELNMTLCIDFYTYDLKAPSTPLSGLSSSVISDITNPFSFSNIDQHYYSVKSITQSQPTKYFLDN